MTNLILSGIAFLKIDQLHSSRTFDLWELGLPRALYSTLYNDNRLLFPLRLPMESSKDPLACNIASEQGLGYSGFPLCERHTAFRGNRIFTAAAAKSLQLCPSLCDPIDVSPPGSPAPGILQARILEWVAISFSNAWKWKSESEVAQSCLTLSDPMDCSLPGSSIHGIVQARVLEWGAILLLSVG